MSYFALENAARIDASQTVRVYKAAAKRKADCGDGRLGLWLNQPAPLASQEFALPWLMSFDARQQFFFQRSPEPREPLNFCLGTIDSLDNLAEPLNLRLETIEQLDDLAVLVAKRVEAWVCRHQSAHGLFILGEPCQQ